MSVFKTVRFALRRLDYTPIKFAFIKAKIVPELTYGRMSMTLIPDLVETRTNEYGQAELTLYVNDVLAVPDSKYLITITYNNKNYNFLVRLEESMADVVDFEHLINRDALTKLKACENPEEGKVKLQGTKYYY